MKMIDFPNEDKNVYDEQLISHSNTPLAARLPNGEITTVLGRGLDGVGIAYVYLADLYAFPAQKWKHSSDPSHVESGTTDAGSKGSAKYLQEMESWYVGANTESRFSSAFTLVCSTNFPLKFNDILTNEDTAIFAPEILEPEGVYYIVQHAQDFELHLEGQFKSLKTEADYNGNIPGSYYLRNFSTRTGIVFLFFPTCAIGARLKLPLKIKCEMSVARISSRNFRVEISPFNIVVCPVSGTWTNSVPEEIKLDIESAEKTEFNPNISVEIPLYMGRSSEYYNLPQKTIDIDVILTVPQSRMAVLSFSDFNNFYFDTRTAFIGTGPYTEGATHREVDIKLRFTIPVDDRGIYAIPIP